MYIREQEGKFSQNEVNKIIELYESGLHQKEIANLFGTFNTSIRRILLRNGVKVLNQTERNRAITPDFFNDYENINIQYWLGVIASDGCITKGTLVVETKDKEWMEDLRDFLNPNINITETLPKKGSRLYRVATRVLGLTEELEKYGIVKQKSLYLEWKYPITSHFLRGVFDGDGSAAFSKKSKFIRISIVSGSKVFLEQIQEFLSINSIYSKLGCSEINRLNPLYSLTINKFEDKLRFYHLIYKDARYFLKRKKERMDMLLTVVKDYGNCPRAVKLFNGDEEIYFRTMREAANFLKIDQRRFSALMKYNKEVSKIYKCEFVINET